MRKTALLGATVLFAAGAMGWALVACGNSEVSANANSNESSVVSDAKNIAREKKQELDEARAADYGVKVEELTEPVVSIAYGDYEAMGELSHQIQNGDLDGKVVKIDGVVAHPITSYAIVQTVPDPKSRVGSSFIIQGALEDAYPVDGAHIEMTAKVCEMAGDYGGRVLVTLPEAVKILD